MDFTLVKTASGEYITIKDFLVGLKDEDYIAVDTEGTGLKVYDGTNYAHGLSITYRHANHGMVSHYFPFRHRFGDNLGPESLWLVQESLQNYQGVIAFHNAPFDLASLWTLGINLIAKRALIIDTQILANLVNENWPASKSLESLGMHYLKRGKKDKPADNQWDIIPAIALYEYACEDTNLTYDLAMLLMAKLIKLEVWEYYTTIKYKSIYNVLYMMMTGIIIDTELCARQEEVGTEQLNELKQIMGINPGSRKDLEKLLINELGLPVVKRSPKTSAPSFDKEAMSQYDVMLEEMDDLSAQHISTYRGWQKAVSSCYRAYQEKLSIDGRLRTHYLLFKDADEGGTTTGRLSSREPNLQQIPKNSNKPWSGRIKKAFLAATGYTLIEADYSQLELRLATAVAGIESLKKVFIEGRDIFDEMAEQLGMPRQDVKTMVYTIQYGGGLDRLIHVFKVTRAVAKDRREGYFRQYPQFKEVTAKATARATTLGNVRIWSGRYRNFISPSADGHKAFNSYIQGGAADIMEVQMNRVMEEIVLPSNDAVRMLMQVHDSLVFEVRNDVLEEYRIKIKEVMEDVRPDFGVRFAVDVHNWGE